MFFFLSVFLSTFFIIGGCAYADRISISIFAFELDFFIFCFSFYIYFNLFSFFLLVYSFARAILKKKHWTAMFFILFLRNLNRICEKHERVLCFSLFFAVYEYAYALPRKMAKTKFFYLELAHCEKKIKQRRDERKTYEMKRLKL